MIDQSTKPQVVTVTLNTAVDRLVSVREFRVGSHQKGRLMERVPAGKGVNVSRCLAQMGLGSIATGFVGFGERTFFCEHLSGMGVGCDFVPVTGHTRENVTIVDPTTREETHIREEGFEVGVGDFDELKRRVTAQGGRGTIFVVCGSLPCGLTRGAVEELFALIEQREAKLAIDMEGDLLAMARSVKPTVIKPNRAEFEEMIGCTLSSERRLLAEGLAVAREIDIVLVSCGANGAYLFVGDVVIRATVNMAGLHVVSTVGCGDALFAGLLAGLVRGEHVSVVLREAVAVASASAMSVMPSVFDARDRDELLQRVSVKNMV